MSETDGKEHKMQGKTGILEPWQIDGDELADEIGRYLAAVDVFQAEGCEPGWAHNDETALTAAAKSVIESISVEPEARDLV